MIGFYAIRDLIPLYAVYSLLFLDHGVSTGQVSTLLVIWSITAFVMEVPSGAWADAVSRRSLLILSSFLHAVGFALWMAVPSYAGYAAGFVCWGASSALMSGTFEALLYDELAAHDAARSYARLMGWANSLSMVANMVGTVLAAPLFHLGGYGLVGWASVGVASLQGLLAVSLPGAPRVVNVDDVDDGQPAVAEGLAVRYVGMLRSGLSEAMRQRTVRHAVLITALLLSFMVYDEYFALVAREKGAATQTVPILVGLTVAGQAIGTALAGRTARLGRRVIAAALGVAAGLMAVGMAEGKWLGFLAIGVGYGITANAVIVAEARLQDAISGPARATVTSVTGLLSESFSVMVYAAFALGSPWVAVSTLGIALTVPMVVVATLIPRWLPAARFDEPDPAPVPVPAHDSGAEVPIAGEGH
jgi:MFS family permease